MMNTTDTHHSTRITQLEETVHKLQQENRHLQQTIRQDLLHYQLLLSRLNASEREREALYVLAAKFAIKAGSDPQLDQQLADVSMELYRMVLPWREMETHA